MVTNLYSIMKSTMLVQILYLMKKTKSMHTWKKRQVFINNRLICSRGQKVSGQASKKAEMLPLWSSGPKPLPHVNVVSFHDHMVCDLSLLSISSNNIDMGGAGGGLYVRKAKVLVHRPIAFDHDCGF